MWARPNIDIEKGHFSAIGVEFELFYANEFCLPFLNNIYFAGAGRI